MSGFLNALALGTRARLDREQLDVMDRRKAAAPHVSAAIGGDQSAIGRIAEADPEYALKIGSLIQGLDANKQMVLKRAADFTTQAGMGILNAPPGERAAAFEAARVEAQRNGIPTESWPKAYDANAESWLKFNVNKAIPVATWFNKQNKGTGGGGPAQFDFATPGGGGGAPAPMPQPRAGVPVADAQPPGQPPVQVAQAPMPAGVPTAQPPMPGAGIAQGDEPPRADGSGNPLQPPPQRPTGSIWNEDPTKHGLVMRGERDRYGNVKPVDVGGHFLYRDPRTNEHVLYKPREAKPTERPMPQPGYQWTGELDPDGRPKQAPITGGGADVATIAAQTEARRRADEKAIPGTVTKGIQENVNALKQIDRALEAVEKTPDSIGGPGSVLAANIPGVGLIQNRIDTEGVKLRALIADIGSLKIHDRSGAAVTASEFPRLRPFIPTISDNPATVKDKLANFRAEYESAVRDAVDYYGPSNGFREYTPAAKYLRERDGTPEPKGAGNAPQQDRALFEARDAISKGASKEAVIERLRKMGVDPSGL